MTPLMRETLEKKRHRRARLIALSYPEKVRIVEQMRHAALRIKVASDRNHPGKRGGSSDLETAGSVRQGLYIRGKNAHPEVRQSVIWFARWLRINFEFPIRVPVYLFSTGQILTRDRKLVSATFFAPFDREQEPYIRVATGDYALDKKKRGRDNALASILCSVAHEIIHYRQWCEGKPFLERQAIRGADQVIRNYSRFVQHP